MKRIASFILFASCVFAAGHAAAQVAVLAKCVLTKWDKKSAKWVEVWSGGVPDDPTEKNKSWNLIAWPGGSLNVTKKDWKDLKAHDGKTVISLYKSASQLQAEIGHVDSSNKKSPARTDAYAWTAGDAKEIGLAALDQKLHCALR